VLRVQVHPMSNPRANRAIAQIRMMRRMKMRMKMRMRRKSTRESQSRVLCTNLRTAGSVTKSWNLEVYREAVAIVAWLSAVLESSSSSSSSSDAFTPDEEPAGRPDLLPDLEEQVLRVQVHPMSNPRANRAIAHLLEHLNAAEFTYPGTNLQLVYSIAGEAETTDSAPHQNPRDQEV
jgi:transposase-like protein